MLTWNGWDALPEAMVVPEAQCDVCDEPVIATGRHAGIVVMGYWPNDEDRTTTWTPLLVSHRQRCDRVLRAALRDSGAFDLWEDLDVYLRQLAHNTAAPVVADGIELLCRHPRRIDLRRAADMLETVALSLNWRRS